jgi:hypothetical protein
LKGGSNKKARFPRSGNGFALRPPLNEMTVGNLAIPTNKKALDEV